MPLATSVDHNLSFGYSDIDLYGSLINQAVVKFTTWSVHLIDTDHTIWI